jgi:hypothetical protein
MTDVFAISWVGGTFSQKNEDWLAISLRNVLPIDILYENLYEIR